MNVILLKLKKLILNSKAPNSNFHVAACAVFRKGVSWGVNIEINNDKLTLCAERIAICSGLTNGYEELIKLYVLCTAEKPVTPCYACREFIKAFSSINCEVVVSNYDLSIVDSYTFDKLPLITRGFKKEDYV